MKQAIILWFGAIVVTIIVGYLQSTLSTEYPAMAKVDVGGQYISYIFDKVYHGNDGYKIWIEPQVKNISGFLQWRDQGEDSTWNNETLVDSNGIFIAEIPPHPPLSKVEYRAKINYIGKEYILPQTNFVTLEFFGRVSPQISMFYFLTLMGGILLAARTGWEYFHDKPRNRTKMYTIFTAFFFFCFTFAFCPIKRTYELNAIGSNAVPLSSIFPIFSVLLFLIWVVTLVLVFNTKKTKLWGAIGALATMAVFLISGL